MAAFSGKNGKVKIGSTSLADVTKWSAEHKANVATFGSSTSGGWKSAVAGTEELTGDLEAKLQDTDSTAPIAVGATVTLELDTGELKLSGSAIFSSVAYEVDIDSGEPVAIKASFVSSGAWSYSAGS